MTKKKRKGRIRQTRTEFQKVFDESPEMIRISSWSDIIPEVLHISMALIDNEYQVVRSEYEKICDFVNSKMKSKSKFFFNLTDTVSLIKKDPEILEKIYDSKFKEAFQNILDFYEPLFEIVNKSDFTKNPKLLYLGYNQILNGKSESSILCKYLMIQYLQKNKNDPHGLFNWQSKEEILSSSNVPRIMSLFSGFLGESEKYDLALSEKMWLLNYTLSPLYPKPDNVKIEEAHYSEMKIVEFKDEFQDLYTAFKRINLTAVYTTFVAEISMGFVSRICNLSLDVVDLEKEHKGEIAEMVFRTNLEAFITGSWLVKMKDGNLYKRYRDYSMGREKFFSEKLAELAPSKSFKKEAEKIGLDAIEKEGASDFDVASERGDVFDKRIDQMADEVWGKDNQYYFLYKRLSEVIHGHWKVTSKYHLTQSLNPMHNGLYWYNESPNRYAGLIPSFISLDIATEFLITILNDIPDEHRPNLQSKLKDYKRRLMEQYMIYFKKYILSDDAGESKE